MTPTEKAYKYIVNTSSDFITLISKSYIYEVVNDSYCKVIKKEKEEIMGHHVADIWGSERFENKIKGHLDKCLSGNDIHYIEEFEFGDSHKYMHVSYYPYKTEGEITHVLVFSHDITKLGEIEAKLINYEYRDPFTGLFNRKSLDIILDMELEKAKRSKHEKLRALFFISITNLQQINLEQSYSIGSMLLENTGIRIKEFLRNSDYVFRYDGNELVVLLSYLTGESDSAKVAQKLINAITIPYRNKNYDIALSCNIGVSLYPQDGGEPCSLIQSAINALCESMAKSVPFSIYNDKIHDEAVRRLKLESDLHRAFEQNQFQLNYQPIVDLEGRIKGCETLIRWKHPERGFISPVEFIPIAENNGLINSIGKWVVFQTINQMKKWCLKYNIYISINLTAREFASKELIDLLNIALKEAGNISPEFLKLEITESSGMDDPLLTIERMKQLSNLGFDLFIDDFGTGQSSLAYLKDIPAKTLKIDKSFVDEIVIDENSRSYLKLIIDIAKNRKKKIVVEGVETAEQFQILKEMDCGFIQGYYFSKPVSSDQFQLMLEEGLPLPDIRKIQ
ncbi:MAG: EAL domain-containing protein [Spirochaetaceae bacterium]|jgi:diguanylate cyclase (GGDEF)-like protein/PAS domain S-box-containing protein|nr:EAL domain-containing protein [Spirochaetaceae bacterium]